MKKKAQKFNLKDLKIKSFVTDLKDDVIKGGRPPNTGQDGICTEEC